MDNILVSLNVTAVQIGRVSKYIEYKQQKALPISHVKDIKLLTQTLIINI